MIFFMSIADTPAAAARAGRSLPVMARGLRQENCPVQHPHFKACPTTTTRFKVGLSVLRDCWRIAFDYVRIICAPVFEVLSLIMFSKDGIPKKPETEARVRAGTAPGVKAATPPAMPSEHTITLRHILFSFDCAHVDSAKEAGVSPPKNGLISLQTPRTLITDYLYFNRI